MCEGSTLLLTSPPVLALGCTLVPLVESSRLKLFWVSLTRRSRRK